MKKINKKGFTIVELVIVIAVIGILAAVLIPTFANVIENANKNAALQEAQSVYKEVLAADLLDGKLDGEIGTSKVMNETVVNVSVLTDAGIKIATGAELTAYDPDAKGTAAEGQTPASLATKFKYKAKNGKTVELQVDASGVETWNVA